MEIIMDEYKVIKRTDYSKPQLFNIKTNENITSGNEKMLSKIIEDYELQKSFPSHYFEIRNNRLLRASVSDMDYVFVPDGVGCINASVFEGCTAKRIIFPETLEFIEKYAFKNCINLRYIKLPDSIITADDASFMNCFQLENIDLSSSLISIDREMFKNCASLKSIYIPDSCTSIGENAFDGCTSLEHIRLSNEIRILAGHVFANCKKLKEIQIPQITDHIGQSCFLNCRSLTEFKFPDMAAMLGDEIFLGCKNIEKLILPKLLFHINNRTFSGLTNLKELTLPETITVIDSDAFINTPNVTKINIPKNLRSLYKPAFTNSNIKTLIFNYDLNIDKRYDKPNDTKQDLIFNSNIERLEIGPNVKIITPEAFKYSGTQIREIQYTGSEKEFEEFKKNNSELFKILSNIEKTEIIKKTVSYERFGVDRF